MAHVTVTIPTYNRGRLVGRTIDSVLNQTFRDIDVIVVDDASTDFSVEVAKEYAKRDARVRFEVNPRNLGLTRNWNRCLGLAAGPLVQIMQSDDMIDPDYLQLVSDIFEAHPSIGFVAASCRYIDENDIVIHPGTPIPAREYHQGDEAVSALLTRGYPHVSSIIMRRAGYEEVGKFDEAIWHGPDMEMDARLAARYGFYHLGAVHTSFRRHGSNMGNLEYLRGDFMEVDRMKKRKTWGYLSPDGLSKLGVANLNQHLARDAAATALNGAIVTLAYGRSRLTRHYLREAVKFDAWVLRTRRWWVAAALGLAAPLGTHLLERRLRLNSADQAMANVTENSLKEVGLA